MSSLPRHHRFLATLATLAALLLSLWLAAMPGQAEDQSPQSNSAERRPLTCTDAVGILYERGTPGFERCLMETGVEQAGQVDPPASAKDPQPQGTKKPHPRKSG